MDEAAQSVVMEGHSLSRGNATITAQPVVDPAGNRFILGVVTGNSGGGGLKESGFDIADKLEARAEELGFQAKFTEGGHLPKEHSERIHQRLLGSDQLTPLGPSYTNNKPCTPECATAQRAIDATILAVEKLPSAKKGK